MRRTTLLLSFLAAQLLTADGFTPSGMTSSVVSLSPYTSRRGHTTGWMALTTPQREYPPRLSNSNGIPWYQQSAQAVKKMTAGLTFIVLLLAPLVATAADFAGKDISGQDFAGQDLSKRDFTGVVAKGANFRNSNLEGAQFGKANLVDADFSGANVRGANFVDAVLDGSSFKDVTGERASFSGSILDISTIKNADLTDSVWPSKFRIMICDMDELDGKNPVTGIETGESLMCTDVNYKS